MLDNEKYIKGWLESYQPLGTSAVWTRKDIRHNTAGMGWNGQWAGTNTWSKNVELSNLDSWLFWSLSEASACGYIEQRLGYAGRMLQEQFNKKVYGAIKHNVNWIGIPKTSSVDSEGFSETIFLRMCSKLIRDIYGCKN